MNLKRRIECFVVNNYNIIILLVIILITSCSDKRVEKYYYDSGEIEAKEFYSKNNKILKSIFYYKNKKMKQVVFYKNELLESVTNFQSNGNVESEIWFKNNLEHGLLKKYDSKGKFTESTLFIDGVPKAMKIKNILKSGENFITEVLDSKVLDIKVFENSLLVLYYQINKGARSFVGLLTYSDKRFLYKKNYFFNIGRNTPAIISDSVFYNITCKYSLCDNFSFDIKIGQLDSNLNFVDSTHILYLPPDTNNIKFCYKNIVYGYNLILGKVYFKNNGVTFKEEIFYDSFFIAYKDKS